MTFSHDSVLILQDEYHHGFEVIDDMEARNEPPAYTNQPFNTGLLVAVILITVGTSLMLTPVLLPNNEHLEDAVAISLFTERVIATFSTTFVVGWMICFRNNICFPLRNTLSTTNDDSKSLLRTLVAFGVGSVLYCIFAIVCDRYILAILKHVVHVIFVLCILGFFYSFNPGHIKFKNIPLVHAAFTFLIIVTSWTWLGMAITPIMLIEPYENETYITRCNVLPFNESREHDNCPVVIDMLERFFEPFYIEFPSIVILFLISQWLTTLSHSFISPSCDFIAWNSRQGFFKPRVSVPLSVLFACIYVGALLYSETVDPMLYTIIKSTFRIIVLLPIFLIACKLRSWRDSANCQVSSSETVLILISCSDVLWFMFRFISSAACIHLDEHVTGVASTCMCYAILSVVQPVIQTKLFLDLRRKQKPLYVKSLLILLASYNFAEWLNRSINHDIRKGRPLSISPFVNALFGQNITRMILLLIRPLMIFFRFHSGMVAVELIQEKNELHMNEIIIQTGSNHANGRKLTRSLSF